VKAAAHALRSGEPTIILLTGLALREKGLSLIVVSSEIEELVAYSTRVIVLRDRAHVAELDGNRITTHEIVEAIAATNERRAS